MKKAIIITASILSIASIVAKSQTIQASLGPGSAPNRVKVYVKTSAPVANTNISTLQFNLAINEAITPKPAMTLIPNNTNFPSVSWQTANTTLGGYYHFNIVAVTAPIVVTSLNTTSEVEVLEVEFSGGALGLHDMRLVTLPGGGNGNEIFYCTGTPSSVGTSLYFTRQGVSVTNGNSYDGGDVSFAQIGNVALPVSFLNFFAIKNGDNAKLNWTVENDDLNSFFDLERSTDGVEYKPFNKVLALQNGQSTNTYESLDEKLSGKGSKTLYYRIKQVDKTGTITYSNIRILNVDNNNGPLSLFPNPARNITKLVIDAEQAGRAMITIRDMHGRQVQQVSLQLQKGINQQDLNVSQFASGEYNINVYGPAFNPKPVKLIKIN